MKKSFDSVNVRIGETTSIRKMQGFSLIELVVAMGVFTLIAGAAFDLVVRNQPAAEQQQMMSGLNIGLRNALSQLQTDISNAGDITNEANVPGFPLGAVITNNNPTTDCHNATTYTYGATCFDQLTLIMADTGTNPGYAPVALNPAASFSVVSNSSMLLAPDLSGATTDAGYFKSGDEVLVENESRTAMTGLVLTANGSVSGTSVKLQYTSIPTDGVAADTFGITAHSNPKLAQNAVSPATDTFGTSDWVIRLNPIVYSVSTANASDPQLIRTQGQGTLQQVSVVADQIIGFKVGASLWSGASDSVNYCYDPSQYNCNDIIPTNQWDFTLIQSIRTTLIARTVPNPSMIFRNTFDQGPYEIQAMSITVNPRNLSLPHY